MERRTPVRRTSIIHIACAARGNSPFHILDVHYLRGEQEFAVPYMVIYIFPEVPLPNSTYMYQYDISLDCPLYNQAQLNNVSHFL